MAAPLTERSLRAMNWKGSREYQKAERKVWKIFKSDKEVAGYVRQVDNFHQVGTHFGAFGLWEWESGLKTKPKNINRAWLASSRGPHQPKCGSAVLLSTQEEWSEFLLKYTRPKNALFSSQKENTQPPKGESLIRELVYLGTKGELEQIS